jgi:hypothetical protein
VRSRQETPLAVGPLLARLSSSTRDPNDGGVGDNGAFLLPLDEPEVYGLPPDPVVPARPAGDPEM